MKRLALLWACLIGVVAMGIAWGLTDIRTYPGCELYTEDALVTATPAVVVGSVTLSGIEYSSWTINATILDVCIHNTDTAYNVYYGSHPNIVSTRRIAKGGSAFLLPNERIHCNYWRNLYFIADTARGGNAGSTVTITIDYLKSRSN